MDERRELRITPALSLVHEPAAGCGKTKAMDKGLFIRFKGRLCAGESTGIGLPVLMARGRTFFPTCTGIEAWSGEYLSKHFRMDRFLQWRMGGRMLPQSFSRAMECLADAYALVPRLQRGLLGMRDRVLALVKAECSMVQGTWAGDCTVIYEAVPAGVRVRVSARNMKGVSKLVMANEADGRSFTRLCLDGQVFEGQKAPAWRRALFEAAVESPVLGLRVSVVPFEGVRPLDCSMFCGREVGYLLDWAGVSLVSRGTSFSYGAVFAELL